MKQGKIVRSVALFQKGCDDRIPNDLQTSTITLHNQELPRYGASSLPTVFKLQQCIESPEMGLSRGRSALWELPPAVAA